MRVMYLTEESDRAEAALMAGLKQEGAEVHAFGSFRPNALEELTARGIRITPLKIKGRLDLAAARFLREEYLRLAPSLVHAFTSRTLSAATLGLRGLRAMRFGYRGTEGNLSYFNPADWITYLNPSLAGIMCVSEAVRASLLALRIPPDRLRTVYKGHNLDWYPATSPESKRREPLREFGIPEEARVVGLHANMRRVKGADVLLQAAKTLPLDGSVHYLLVGEIRDPEISKLACESPLKPVVHLAGYRQDGVQLMAACDICVFPSRAREGLPKALLESMAYARPVIASRVGGIPEVITDGADGVLVSPEQPPELSAALAKLLHDSDLRLKLGCQARSKIGEKFGVSPQAKLLLNFYKERIESLCTPR